MLEVTLFILGAVVGAITTLIVQNRQYDNLVRQEYGNRIDVAIRAMHAYYDPSRQGQMVYQHGMNFALKDLLIDNKLKPILGEKYFCTVFEPIRNNLFALSMMQIDDLPVEEIRPHVERANDIAVKLRSATNYRAGSFRIHNRK